MRANMKLIQNRTEVHTNNIQLVFCFSSFYNQLYFFLKMKFTIATLFTLALAMGVQSSVIPWGNVVTQVAGGPLSYTAVSSPIAAPWPLGGAVVVGHPAAAIHSAIPAAIPAAVHAAVPAAVPAVVAAGHAVVPGHAAGYVAQTRGAVHTAPLAGHLNSVANLNVAPAPGTH